MRRAKVGSSLGPEFADTGVGRVRAGRTRLRLLSRSRVVLLLAGVIGLPWLPIPVASPPDLPMHRVRGTSGAPLRLLALSPDGQIMATADYQGRVAMRPSVEDWGIERHLDSPDIAWALAFAPDGRHLAIGRMLSDIVLYDLPRGDRPRLLGIPVGMPSSLRFSPDGRTLAVGSYRSSEILLWDLEAGRPRMTLRRHDGPVTALAFAPDGQSLASAGHAGPVPTMGSALDRQTPDPAGGYSPEVLISDLADGRPRRYLVRPPDFVPSIAYSPDGRLLAAASTSRESVRIWDVRTGALIRLIAGRPQPTLSVAFSPDGRLLATAGLDGTAGLWSLATGRELHRLDGRAAMLTQIAFSPDGRTLMAVGSDEDIRLWDLEGRGAREDR